MTTTHVRRQDTEERWLLYDASEHNLGRMAAHIAMALQGKDRPTWTPSERTGAHVVVINGAKPRLTGKKGTDKIYRHYSGFPNGQKYVAIEKVAERRPADIVTLAVRRMLPKTRLGRDMLRCLKVYGTDEHPHTAQSPVKVESL
ncbi:MAG: large subunit ribosomal protein L13 [Planctomycetota bacterium]|jgi:large subunit ribosomal protein L13